MCLYIDAMLYTFIYFFSLFTVRASTQRTNNSKIYHGDEITKEKKNTINKKASLTDAIKAVLTSGSTSAMSRDVARRGKMISS